MKTQITFKNGDSYDGEVVDNKFHGLGEYTSIQGYTLEGTFTQGLPSTKMTLHLREKNIRIFADFLNSNPLPPRGYFHPKIPTQPFP